MKITQTISGFPEEITLWIEAYMARMSQECDQNFLNKTTRLKITRPTITLLLNGWQLAANLEIYKSKREDPKWSPVGDLTASVTTCGEDASCIEIDYPQPFEKIISRMVLGLLNHSRKQTHHAAFSQSHRPDNRQAAPEPQDEPWNKVMDNNYDRLLVRYVWQGLSDPEIARTINRDKKTVTTRLSTLRKFYGPELVPYRKDLPNRSSSG
jgi:hypothetical protein